MKSDMMRVVTLMAGITLMVVVAESFSASQEIVTSGHSQSLIPSSSTEGPAPAAPWFPEWWEEKPQLTGIIPCKEPGSCVSCHEAHATMDASHAFACTRCHHGDSAADQSEQAHKGLVRDPGDLNVVESTCGSCHPEEVRRVKASPMALSQRMIALTRFAFGAQREPVTIHGTVDSNGLTRVPHPSRSSNLGDDLLRRSCLRCHLYTQGSKRWGEHRGKGCSACHVPYPNSGDGKPIGHAIVRSLGVTACLKCHNGNHVGADYVGLYERDFHRGFQAPYVDGALPPRIYGGEQHRLSSDLHFQAGMSCADCHTLDEIHGTGTSRSSSEREVTISCESCHVRADHPAVLKASDGTAMLLRAGGRTVPSWRPDSLPHKVSAHRQRLKCSACHAAWSFQDYGFHLMLEERADYWKWAPTAQQNDPQVQGLLMRYVGTFVNFVPPASGTVAPVPEDQWELPVTQDWLTGEKRLGAWYRGYTARRWEKPPLGLDGRGRVSIMRPMHQYVVSHVDKEGKLLLDRVVPTTGGGFPALLFNPYSPHTIGKKGRACHDCHGNPKVLGLGNLLRGFEKPTSTAVWSQETQIPGHRFRWDALVDEKGAVVQRSSHPGARPLDQETIRRLLNPSDTHRAAWSLYLKRDLLRSY